MTSTFSSKKASKISKRKLGMESLENREMLSVNPLGVDAEAAPDFVQAPAAASQDFNTEAAKDISAFTATTTTATAVTFSVTFTDPGVSQDYSLYYTACSSSTFDGTGTWTKIATKSAASGDTSVTFDSYDATTISAGAAAKYIFFGVAQGSANSLTGGFAAGQTDKIADTTNKVTIAASTVPTSNATVSVSGVTTSAATLTWTKPTTFGTNNDKVGKVITYHVTVGGKTYDTTKTTYTVTGLTGTPTYTITADIEDATTAKAKHTVAIGTGSIPTLAAGTAADVIVGPVTGINAAFQAAKTGTVDGIKVTWKAPTNYAGSYTVTVDDGTGKTLVKTVAAGAKTEALLTATDIGTTGFTPENNKYYKVTVVAGDGTASIAAPSVTIAVGKPTSGAPAALATTPAVTPTSVAATAATFGSVNVTVTAATTPEAIGYWVGLSTANTSTTPSYTTVKAATTTVGLVYVAAADITKPVVFSGLDASKTYGGVAFAVAVDGTVTDIGTGQAATVPMSNTVFDTIVTNITNSYIKSDKLTLTAGTGANANKTTVKWDVVAPATSDTNVIERWIVSYSADGGDTWVEFGATTATTTVTHVVDVTGLNLPGIKYQFKVQAVVITDGAVGTGHSFKEGGLAKAVTATASKANVAAPAKVANLKVDATLSETQISAKWDAVTGAVGYNVTLSDGKGIVGVYFVTTNAYLSVDTLVPKVKYAVAVEAVYYDAANAKAGKTAAANVSISTVDWAAATVKLASGVKPGLLSAEIEITLGKGMADGKFAVEYTSVVDAKGKPDWNAAAYVSGANAAAAATAFKNVQLAPNTQYFVRAVYFAGTDAETDVTKTVLSKDLKFKTATPPLATVGKAGFGLVNDNFGFKFDFKTPEQNKKANAAEISGTTYTYKLWVASDKAKVDKATGKLEGAIQIEFNSAPDAVDLTSATYSVGVEKSKTDSTIVAYALKDAIGFSEITGLATTWKSVQYQLEVIYKSSSATPQEYYSNFTKPGKLALPKWFV